jgi:hypothetical protein
MQKLKNPYMRMQLKSVLASLGDVNHQSTVWLAPPDVERSDSFSLCVSVLFDDLLLGESDTPGDLVGDIVLNDDEANKVMAVVQQVDNLLKAIGTEASDEEYVRHPAWANVVSAAKEAEHLLTTNDGT